MTKQLLMASVLIGWIGTLAWAQTNPVPNPRDSRIKMVSFQENNVVPVHGKTFTTTQIVFADNEYVKGIEGGDTAGWIVDYKLQTPNMIFIKPTVLNSNSNITVVTNRHHYYFKVTSNKKLDDQDKEVTYAIKFSYPAEARAQLNARLKQNAIKKSALINTAKNPKNYNWNYRFSGNKQIMPLHVFDDGNFTYFGNPPIFN